MVIFRTLFTISLVIFLIFGLTVFSLADDGYRLWLKYDRISDAEILDSYRKVIKAQYVIGNSATGKIIEDELFCALKGLLGKPVRETNTLVENTLIVASSSALPIKIHKQISQQVIELNNEGFLIKTIKINGKKSIVISAKNDIGLLYGVFKFISLLQTYRDINNLNIVSSPKIKIRVLNHWDNLDRTIERGYAGFSLWDWHKLPDYIHPYYVDYARANASLGINGTVLNNVNVNALILTPLYLKKVAALADVFRPYGI